MKRILSVSVFVFFSIFLITACGKTILETDKTVKAITNGSSDLPKISITSSMGSSSSNIISAVSVPSSTSVGTINSSSGDKSSNSTTRPSTTPIVFPSATPMPTKALQQYNVFSTLLPLTSDNKYGSRYIDVVERGDKDGLIAVGNVYTDNLPIGAIDKFDLKLNVVRSVRLKDTRIITISNAVDGGYLVIAEIDKAILIKIDKDLNEEWRETIDEIRGKPYQLDNGDIILFKSSFPPLNESSMFVYDQFGGVLKSKIKLLVSGDIGYPQIEKDSDGGFFVVGGVVATPNTSVQINGFGLGSEDAYILKFSKDYTLTWSKGFGGRKEDFFEKIFIDNDGFIYAVMGSNSVDKDLANLSLVGDGLARILFKIDKNGEVLKKTVLSKYGWAVPIIGGITKIDEKIIVMGWSRYEDGILNKFPVISGEILSENTSVIYVTTVNGEGEISDSKIIEVDINYIETAVAFLKNGEVIIPGGKIVNNVVAKIFYRFSNFKP